MADSYHEDVDGGGDQKPLFTFGVIADVQYADRKDGVSGWKTMRYYRQSLLHLRQAIAEWNEEDIRPKFVLQLGDFIDGSNFSLSKSEHSLQVVLKEIENIDIPFHHIWGNHELLNFNRDQLMETALNTMDLADRGHEELVSARSADCVDYYAYHFSPFPKFRCVVVDSYDMSIYGRDPTHPKHQESSDVLHGNERSVWSHISPVAGADPQSVFRSIDNALTEHPTSVHAMSKILPLDGPIRSVLPLYHLYPQLKQFNGGFGEEQLSWLHEVLTFSDEHKERVFIASHVPIHPKATLKSCLAWNYTDMLELLHSHPSVVCYFAGHDHNGGFHEDECGVYHVTMEGVIESPATANAFATVSVHGDRLVLHGRGRVKSRILPYKKKHERAEK